MQLTLRVCVVQANQNRVGTADSGASDAPASARRIPPPPQVGLPHHPTHTVHTPHHPCCTPHHHQRPAHFSRTSQPCVVTVRLCRQSHDSGSCAQGVTVAIPPRLPAAPPTQHMSVLTPHPLGVPAARAADAPK